MTRLIDSSCNVVVNYEYDSWGKLLSITDSLTSTVGIKIPIRYRGYYYDTETSLYYLNSRYYDPEVGRFVSPDNITVALEAEEFNLYSYCLNDPINNIDPTGYWSWKSVGNWFKDNWQWVAGAAIIVGLGIAVIATGGAAAGVVGFIVAGAFKGAIIGAASGALIGGAIGGVTGGEGWSWDNALEGAKNGFFSGAVTGAITGAATNALKVGQAAQMWQAGTSLRTSTPFKTMVHHYKAHGQGFGNIVNYSKQASEFAIKNANSLSFVARNPGLTPHWTWIGKVGMNGHFTSAGKILTFWM